MKAGQADNNNDNTM